MTWNTPIDWQVDQLVTAEDLNSQLRDNLNYLKDPPTASYILNEATDFASSSSSWVDVDGAGSQFQLTIDTSGGDVMIGFHGFVCNFHTGVTYTYFDVDLDGTRIGGDDGLCLARLAAAAGLSQNQEIAFVHLHTELAAGSHTFKLQWRVIAGTTYLYAGAGTSYFNLHPQFWVREV